MPGPAQDPLGLLSLSLPSHLLNTYPSFGVAVTVIVATSLYIPLASGEIVPPSSAFIVKVY
ncbi:MAG: hypothetical protein P8N57_02500 [Flavobacteriaceae bacterium]|nr:hypothetical protein [Flavobacteriaceae bacterium]